MTQREEAALFIFQRSRHLPTELRERILDNFLKAPANDRLSLEEYAEHQEAIATIFGSNF